MKNVLTTGGTGFLGNYILEALLQENYSITNIGRSPNVKENIETISIDLSKEVPVLPTRTYEKIVHIAGKAHVFPKTKEDEEDFFSVNLNGTKNLLLAIDTLTEKPKFFIFISTVAVYGLIEGTMIDENYPTNANTPYGISKLQAEKLVIEWCKKNNVNFLILRLPLIVGENPPGNLGDMKKAIDKGLYFKIKNNKAQKSIVVASDVAKLIAKPITKSSIFHLTDGENPAFQEIEKAIEQRLNKKIKIVIPFNIINFLAKIGDFFTFLTKKDMPISSLRLKKLVSNLTFDSSKAKKELDWQPTKSIDFISQNI